jgi:hypothetical protein
MILGKLTPQMIRRINEVYAKVPIYKRVAEIVSAETGTKLDERTVKKHVDTPSKRASSAEVRENLQTAKSQSDAQATSIVLKMFRENKSPVDVAIALGLDPKKAIELHTGFQKLMELEQQSEGEPWAYKIKFEELERKYDALDLAKSKSDAENASRIRWLQSTKAISDQNLGELQKRFNLLLDYKETGFASYSSTIRKLKSRINSLKANNSQPSRSSSPLSRESPEFKNTIPEVSPLAKFIVLAVVIALMMNNSRIKAYFSEVAHP